mgnify:CR=1 FL=1
MKYDDYFESEEGNSISNTVIPATDFNFFEGVTRLYENDLDGLINKDLPMHAYWIKYSEGGVNRELNQLQSKSCNLVKMKLPKAGGMI